MHVHACVSALGLEDIILCVGTASVSVLQDAACCRLERSFCRGYPPNDCVEEEACPDNSYKEKPEGSS